MNHDLNIKIVGKVRYRFPELPSTNDYALELCRQKDIKDGTVVIAGYQTHGRGQKDNVWESKPGQNLTLSVIFYPSFLKAEEQFYLNKMVCLAVRSLAIQYLSKPVFIKWPNDIYVETRKISGILIQNLIQGKGMVASVVGIGFNVWQDHFTETAGNATSLVLEQGRAPELPLIEEDLCRYLDQYYLRLKQDILSLDEEYDGHLYRIGQKVHFKIPENETFEGWIIGVDSLGRLMVKDIQGTVFHFNIKEVVYR